mmetsp:Transcript_18271/g.26778  ORF Transcript_18271/g.26778 Transcript_18271/m.26778 type:complete len:244 (-) Transcript_18271:149-880(-)
MFTDEKGHVLFTDYIESSGERGANLVLRHDCLAVSISKTTNPFTLFGVLRQPRVGRDENKDASWLYHNVHVAQEFLWVRQTAQQVCCHHRIKGTHFTTLEADIKHVARIPHHKIALGNINASGNKGSACVHNLPFNDGFVVGSPVSLHLVASIDKGLRKVKPHHFIEIARKLKRVSPYSTTHIQHTPPPSGSEGCLARTERGKVKCLLAHEGAHNGRKLLRRRKVELQIFVHSARALVHGRAT